MTIIDDLLSDETRPKLFLLRLKGYNTTSNQEETYYFANRAYRTEPYDTPPNQYYLPRLETPADFSRSMFREGTTEGKSENDFGVAILNNSDGALDFLQNVAFDGWEVSLQVGEKNIEHSEFKDILNATLELAEFDEDRIILNILNNDFLFATPIQETKYAGTNSGTTGNEGLVDDIKGEPKILCYGECKNVPCVPVNTAALRYQVHDGPIEAVDAVYDKGVLLTLTTDYSVDLNTGIITLVSPPAGQICADIKGDKTGGTYVNTVSDIIKRIAIEQHGRIWPDDFVEQNFTDLNIANSSTVGIYIRGEKHTAEIFDELCSSIRAFWSHNRDGKSEVGKRASVSGNSVANFTDRDVISIRQITSEDENRGIPSFKNVLLYQKNFTVQHAGELASGVSENRKAYLEQEYRKVEAEDATVKNIHKRAVQKERTSLLVNTVDAQTEVDAAFLEDKIAHRRFIVEVRSRAFLLDINQEITITHPRYQLHNGIGVIVYGMREDIQDTIVSLDLRT